MTLHGVDLSDYDWQRGPVDIASMHADGIMFLSHKATESTGIVHSHYGEALNRARAAGIGILGAYHVVRSGDVNAQVRHFLGYLDAQTPWWRTYDGFFVQVDLELWSYDQVSAQTGVAFVHAVRAAQPKTVITYASHGQYGNSLGDVGTPLWNANYPTWRTALGRCAPAPYRQAYANSGGDTGPGWAPYSGQTPTIWQYTDNATIGSQPGCDANAYRGTVDDLRALITGGSTMASDFSATTVTIDGKPHTYGELLTYLASELLMGGAYDLNGPGSSAAGRLRQLATQVGTMQSATAPSQEMHNAAVLNAMLDPRVQKGIGDAIATHLHVTP